MHDGSDTILRDNGTGDLKLYGSRIEIGGASVDETIAFFTENAGAQLYFNNEEKFQTVAIGATVFGDFIVSGVTTSASLKVTGISTFNGDVDINANVDVSGNTVLNGNVDLGDATSDTITATGRFDSDLVPSGDTQDLGTSTQEWRDLFLDGTAHVHTLDVDANAGIIGNLTVTGTSEFNNTVDVDADFAVRNGTTDKFFVDNVTGNTSIQGTLASVGAATLSSTLNVGSNTSLGGCLLYTSPSPRDRTRSRMPSSA